MDTEHLIGGRYRIVSELGKGASATTMLAQDTKADRRVAIKEFFARRAIVLKMRAKPVSFSFVKRAPSRGRWFR